MSRNHGHGESLFHHIKNYPWSSLKISLAEEPEDCEEDILPITVKQQTQNNRNIATNSTDSN